MSTLTSELNLKQAVDADDTEVYLTQDLAGSLRTLDGLFNSATGHTHNGAHQGAALQFQDLLVGGNLTVNGASLLKGAATLQSSLGVTGATTLTTLHVTGAVTLDSTLSVAGVATHTAQVFVNMTTVPALGNGAYADGNIQLWAQAGAAPRIGFAQAGDAAVALYKEVNTENLRLRGASGADVALVTDQGTQTLTNKTFTSPTISSPTVSGGTFTSPTINTPTISGPSISNPTLSGTVSGTPVWAGPQALPAGTTIGGLTGVSAANSNSAIVDSGQTGVVTVPAGGSINISVGFNRVFAVAPMVVVQIANFSGGTSNVLSKMGAPNVHGVGTNGFFVDIDNQTGGQQSIVLLWHAIGR